MFNNNIVKMKKELFVEAESIAYLVKDVSKRKLAFANTVTVMAFHNYIEKNNYPQQITTKLNLFTIPAVSEKFGISDIYLDNLRIEVRASLDGKVFPIPKIQVENSLVADYIVVFKGTKNPLKCEALGYMAKEDLIFDSQDDDYYYISISLLNPLDEFKQKISTVNIEEKQFYETEHKIAIENFGAFIDGDLDEVKSIDLIKHVLACPDCRTYFVEYNYLEDVLRGINHYPELEEQYFSELETIDETQTDEKEGENFVLDAATDAIEMGVAGGIIAGDATLNSEINNITSDLPEISLDNFEINENSNDIILDDLSSENIDLTQDKEDIFEINEASSEETANIDEATFYENDTVINTDNTNLEKEIELDIPEVSDTLDDEIIDFSNEKLEQNENENNFDDLSQKDTIEDIEPNNDEENIVDLSSEVEIISDENEPLEIISDDIIQPIEKIEPSNEISIIDNDEVVEEINEIPLEDQLINLDEVKEDTSNQQKIAEQTISDIQIPQSVFDNNSDTPLEIEDFSSLQENNNDFNFEIDDNNIEINYSDDVEITNESTEEISEQVITENKIPDINLHALYSNNLGTQNNNIEQTNNNISITKDIENIEIPTESAEEFFNDEEMKNNNPIIKEIKPKTKKMKKGFIIAIIGILLFLSGGFLAIHLTKGSVGNIANENSENNIITDGQPQDINETMANTFKEAQFGRKVSKISWEVEQSLSTNPNASEYLTLIGQAIGDNIDTSIQDILLPNPPRATKILIKVNKMGDIQKLVFAESSGSLELDNAMEQTIRQAFATTPMTKYVDLNQDTNLIIVVNF